MKIKWNYEYATGSLLTQLSEVISKEGDYYKTTFTRSDGSETTTHVHTSQVVETTPDPQDCPYCGHLWEPYDDGVNWPSCGSCGGV